MESSGCEPPTHICWVPIAGVLNDLNRQGKYAHTRRETGKGYLNNVWVYGAENQKMSEDAPEIPFPAFLPNLDFVNIFEAHAGLVAELNRFDPSKLVPYVGGLITCPEWQASTLRLEVLQHLIVAASQGTKTPKPTNLKSWLTELGEGIAGRMEDPSEDVFVSRIILPDRDCLIFEGTYEASAFYLQRFLNVLGRMPPHDPFAGLRRSADSLLCLSHAVALRSGVQAHMTGQVMPLQSVPNRLLRNLPQLAQRVLFSSEDLNALGIDPKDLSAFIFDTSERATLREETLGFSTLERFPVFRIDGHFCLALPTAVSIAIRRMVIEFAISADQASPLYDSYARAMANAFTGIRLMGGSPAPAIPFRKKDGIHVADMATCIDEGRFLHFSFIVDEFESYMETGTVGLSPDSERLSKIIDESIVEAHRTYSAERGFRQGVTVVVMCPWGRPVAFGFNGVDDKRWRVETISAADLESVSWIPKFSPRQFWRLLDTQDRLRELNLEIINPNGLLNLYAWSEANNGHLVPHGQIPDDHDTAAPFNILITQNGLLAVRKEGAESWNLHHARTWDGRNVKVRRETPKSFFKENDPAPLYVSFDDLEKGKLTSVFETEQRGWWTEIETPNMPDRAGHYSLWHLMAVWIAKAVPVLEQSLRALPDGPLAWICHFADSDTRDAEKPIPSRAEARALLDISVRDNAIRVTAKPGFLASFRNPTNIGESLLVEGLIAGALRLNGEEPNAERIFELVTRIVPNEWARDMHMFETLQFRHFVRDSMPDSPILIGKLDDGYSRIALGWRKRQRSAGNRITGIDDCCAYLNEVIDGVWEETRAALKTYNRETLVMQLVANHECITNETEHWLRCARAILSLHQDKEQASRASVERMAKFNAGLLSTRILIEIALCECPEDSSAVAGELDVSRLLANVMQMHSLGGWSEAIKYGSENAEIKITPYGDIHTQDEFHEKIATPYGRALGGKRFRHGARNYEKNFRELEIAESVEDNIDPDFWEAWKEAFGFTINELRLFLDNIENAGITRTMFAFIASFDELCALDGVNKMDAGIVKRILDALTLRPRTTWASAPEGFLPRDWYPWRFRRRLSAVSRPVLQLNSEGEARYLIAPGMVRAGALKVIDYCFNGGYEAKDFPPGLMRSWIGAAENKRGHAFNIEVSERLRELGWQTKPNVKLSEILNAKLDRDYGDVDVLAWRDGRVLVIECKDLELAMTISDIARQLHEFRGEVRANGKPDRLKRHLHRVEVLKKESAAVSRYTRTSGTLDIQTCLMFSEIVPMSFSETASRQDVHLAILDEADRL